MLSNRVATYPSIPTLMSFGFALAIGSACGGPEMGEFATDESALTDANCISARAPTRSKGSNSGGGVNPRTGTIFQQIRAGFAGVGNRSTGFDMPVTATALRPRTTVTARMEVVNGFATAGTWLGAADAGIALRLRVTNGRLETDEVLCEREIRIAEVDVNGAGSRNDNADAGMRTLSCTFGRKPLMGQVTAHAVVRVWAGAGGPGSYAEADAEVRLDNLEFRRCGSEDRWHTSFAIGSETPAVGDFNGDGRDDIVTFTHGSTGRVFAALSNGSSAFNGTGWLWNGNFAEASAIPMTGDFNGDGRDDILMFTQNGSGDVSVATSNGSGFVNRRVWQGTMAQPGVLPVVGDFNRDGRDDIATVSPAGLVLVARSRGNSFANPAIWNFTFGGLGSVVRAGDFNGDGRDDLVIFNQGSQGDANVILSRGNRFDATAQRWHNDFAFGNEIPEVGDFNGDGLDDIVTFVRGSRGLVFAARSTGTSFVGTGALWLEDFAAGSQIPKLGDVDGDGRVDAISFTRGAAADVFVSR